MITPEQLIEKFKYALSEHWGYIYATAGILWTKAKQQQKVNYMVSKYGTSWKKNSEAKEDKYYRSAMYGDKWIGHYVADCSGLFVWAYKQYGESIYHGSNSIYDRYCSSKGKITDDIRKSMKPGTAVFVDKNGDKSHIGLFVGNGKVIEAEGTIAGVCTSNLTAGKWTYWGELKGVDYSGTGPSPEPTPTPTTKPTLRKGSTGPYVVECQEDLISLGYDVGKTGADGKFGTNTEKAVKAFQKDHGLVADGIVGSKTWAALDEAVKPVPPVEELYTVSVHHLDKTQAEALMANYPGSTCTKE